MIRKVRNNTPYNQENSHRLLWVDADNRHIISTKSQGFSQTPQDIMESTMGVQSISTLATVPKPVFRMGYPFSMWFANHKTLHFQKLELSKVKSNR